MKQEETNEAAQQQAEVGEPAAAGLVVPVQNGEGDSLNLSAGFIQVLAHASGARWSLTCCLLGTWTKEAKQLGKASATLSKSDGSSCGLIDWVMKGSFFRAEVDHCCFCLTLISQ